MTTSMSDDPRRAAVARAHIAALAFGWGMRPAQLTSVLARGCWPGQTDGTEPAARGWLRAWGPGGQQLQAPGCGCAAGACLICN